MKLIIDNREPKDIINILKSRLINVELDNLNIGDFIIKNNNDELIMIFERKSLSDLMSSIKDGRYNEQSFRLNESELDNHNIFYIIEGNIMNFCLKNNETQQKTLFSSMLSLSYKKGFSLLHTSGPCETAEFLIRFVEKLSKEKSNNIMKNNTTDINDTTDINEKKESAYSSSIKIAKKSNITRDNIGEIMLAQIPGLSINVAQTIMSKYKTINNLINSLTEDRKCIDKLMITCKNGQRKINKTVVEKILEFLL